MQQYQFKTIPHCCQIQCCEGVAVGPDLVRCSVVEVDVAAAVKAVDPCLTQAQALYWVRSAIALDSTAGPYQIQVLALHLSEVQKLWAPDGLISTALWTQAALGKKLEAVSHWDLTQYGAIYQELRRKNQALLGRSAHAEK